MCDSIKVKTEIKKTLDFKGREVGDESKRHQLYLQTQKPLKLPELYSPDLLRAATNSSAVLHKFDVEQLEQENAKRDYANAIEDLNYQINAQYDLIINPPAPKARINTIIVKGNLDSGNSRSNLEKQVSEHSSCHIAKANVASGALFGSIVGGLILGPFGAMLGSGFGGLIGWEGSTGEPDQRTDNKWRNPF